MPDLAILLYEDEAAPDFSPLSLTRPVFELRCGALNLRERLEMVSGDRPLRAQVRSELRPLLASSLPELAGDLEAESILVVNARLLASVATLAQWVERDASEASLLVCAGTGPLADRFAAIRLDAPAVEKLRQAGVASVVDGFDHEVAPPDCRLARTPWDYVAVNGEQICSDFRALSSYAVPARRIFGIQFDQGMVGGASLASTRLGSSEIAMLYPGVHVLEDQNVLFGADARIKSGTVLDASDGPIVLSPGCRIESNVTIQGPAYVGPGSVVHPMTRLREGASVGAFCKIGGEVEESIVLDLSNKQHDGFLGHAYVGSWVNLGAGTTASDLKNNYGTVKVDQGEGLRDSCERFVGPVFGDHAKTGICTMLNTGTVVGVAANLFGSGFPPRFVASFSWGGADGLVEHRLDKALELAKVVFSRRGVNWSQEHAELLSHVHASTAAHRI